MKLRLFFGFSIAIVLLIFQTTDTFAVDRCWDGGGTTNNWSEDANWATDTEPGTGDVAVFDNGTCSGSPDKNATIDATIDVQGINIVAYTGTITQNSSVNIGLGSAGYIQASSTSTFTGVNVSNEFMVITTEGDFNLSSGVFTAPWALVLDDDFTHSGGTFNHNNGIAVFDRSGTSTGTSVLSGNTTFYDMYYQDSSGCSTEVHEIASGTMASAAGTLTFYADTACGVGDSELAVNGGAGGLYAQGDIIASDLGVRYTSTMVNVTINGTGAQALVGEDDYDSALPNLIINKPSGTLTFGTSSTTEKIVVVGNWTYTQGTIDATTYDSEIIFSDNYTGGNTLTLTGSMTFDNLIFYDQHGCTDTTFTVASGTTITTSGTLTFESTQTCGNDDSELFVRGPGGISAQGNVAAVGQGVKYTDSMVTVTVNGTGTQALVGGNDTYTALPNITINKSSGTLTFGTSSTTERITVVGDWIYTQGTIDATTWDSEIIFSDYYEGSDAETNPTLDISGSMSFDNLRFTDQFGCPQPTYTIGSGTTLTTVGTLTFDSPYNCAVGPSELNVDGPGGINAQGNIQSVSLGIRYTANMVSVTVNGTGAQALIGENDANSGFPNLIVDKSSGTLTFGTSSTTERIALHGGWTYLQGTIDATTYDSEIIFDTGADSPGTKTLTGSTTFNRLTITDTIGCGQTTYQISSGTVITATGPMVLNASNTCNPPETNINGPGSLVAQGDLSSTGDGASGNVAITLTGSASQSINLPTTDYFPTGTFTVNKSSGTATLAVAAAFDGSGQDVVIASGTLALGSLNFTVGDVFSMTGGTVSLINSQTVSVASTSFTGGTVEYTGTGTYTSLKLGDTYYSILISGSGSFSPAANVDINGDFTQTAGTFSVAPSGMTLAGDFTRTGGSFTPGSSTVTIDDSTQVSSISGTTTFYNVTSITPNKTIRFASDSTTTVSNALTLRGGGVGLLTLESTDNGYPWHLAVNGTATLSYLSVKDSDACSGSTKPLISAGSIDGGNNYCWSITGGYTEWYNTSWTKRKAINVEGDLVAGSLTDFPVLIKLSSDSSLASYAQDDGDDILITSEDGTTKLSHEIEKFDGATGELYLWVKVPSLEQGYDTRLFMYYGNGSVANQQDITNVWDSNFKGIWHLDETSGTSLSDSTSFANTGTKVAATEPNPTTGITGGGQAFDGTNDYVYTADSFANPSELTVAAWINTSDTSGKMILGFENSQSGEGSSRHDRKIYVGSDGKAYGGCYDGTERTAVSTTTVNDSAWHYIAATISNTGNYVKVYVDGQLEQTTSCSAPENYTGYYRIGSFQGGWPNLSSGYISSIIDEARISSTPRSDEWIETEYNNQAFSSFITISTEGNVPSTNVRGGIRILPGTRILAN